MPFFDQPNDTETDSALAADTLLLALRQALPDELKAKSLMRLTDKGLAHDHVRIKGTGWLARIPKQSQMNLTAADNLAYQRACFERAAQGGHAPCCHAVIPVSASLPRGALLVQEIVGRPAQLPQDLQAIVLSLSALHRVPLPSPENRRPLLNANDPLQTLLNDITAQAQYLNDPHVKLSALTHHAIVSGIQQLQTVCGQEDRPSRHLIAFDGHPGNFVVQADGKAMLVDLEKCRYSYPGLDLAHATLYTSTTWDVDSHAVLSPMQVAQAYAKWEEAMGDGERSARGWHMPLRRAMWLWSLTWCAKWQALSARPSAARGDGEDWSAERSNTALVAHVQERVQHYLSAEVVVHCLDEFTALGTL